MTATASGPMFVWNPATDALRQRVHSALIRCQADRSFEPLDLVFRRAVSAECRNDSVHRGGEMLRAVSAVLKSACLAGALQQAWSFPDGNCHYAFPGVQKPTELLSDAQAEALEQELAAIAR